MNILTGLKRFEGHSPLVARIEMLMVEWQRSYPHIDVGSQIQWAHNWILENPKKDKKNYVRYLGNWMRSAEARAVERKTNIVVHPKYVDNKPKDEDLMTLEDIQKMKRAIRK